MSDQLITVSIALDKIATGESLEGYSIDFDHIKVEALDAMKLVKAGLIVPDTAIYYDDDDTEFDEDFEGDWKRVPDNIGVEEPMKRDVSITVDDDMEQWLRAQDVELDKLIESLLNSFYQTQRLLSDRE